jgi:hypothetical protein
VWGFELRPLGLLALLAGLVLAQSAFAQISPGPLSVAHEELEGVTNCLKCHGLGEKVVDPHCLDCHGEIARLRSDGRGFHARGADGACADCHLEHGGRDFRLVDWGSEGPKAFDHSQAGWPLTGRHAELECAKCHADSLRKSPVMELRPSGSDDETWLGLETGCISCHRDPHENRFGPDCAKCHVTADFRTIVEAAFDHDRTRYSLRGKHATVACTACHPSGFEALPRFGTCRDCHKDPHRGEATLAGAVVDCAECHRVDAFAPSTYGARRHAAARWPLEGKHAAVACSKCHGGPGTETLRFRPKSGACTDCHQDAHAGQLAAVDGGRCDACHGTTGFRPASYDAARHAAIWPLEGAHAKAACRTCHGPDRADLPALPGLATVGSAGALFRVPRTCAECHADPHRSRFGSADDDCRRCHDPAAFSPSAVDASAHAKYEFPLQGAHAAVPCFLCHRDLEATRPSSTLIGIAARWPALELRVAHGTCTDCHADPHGGQFVGRSGGESCAVCHGLDAFRPASDFVHDRDARFPLQGAHAKVACDKCHVTGPRTDGTIGTVFRPLASACEACHATPVGDTP